MRAADPGIEDIYDLGVPITTRGPYPTLRSLRRPIDSPHLTVTVVDLGIPILTRGPYPTGKMGTGGPHITGIMGTGVPILPGLWGRGSLF